MAQVGKKGSNSAPVVHRVSPLKPGLRGARNWATAQVRAAKYTKRGFWRLMTSLIALSLLTVFTALWLGGFLPDARQAGQNFTRSSLISLGFVVDRIDVVGEGRIREQDVRTALSVQTGDFLFEMDMEQAQARVESLSWVELAVVRRLWPDRVVVQIIERTPFALWQNDGKVQLVDAKGEIISDADPLQFAYLPLVLGPGAPTEVTQVRAALDSYPVIAARVDAFRLLPSGRWDIRFKGAEDLNEKIWVKLPLTNMSGALQNLEQLHQAKQILNRDIAMIDMRLPDRLTILPRQTEPV